MKTRWILDRELGRLVSKEAWDDGLTDDLPDCKDGIHQSYCRHYKGDSVSPDKPVDLAVVKYRDDIVSYPQELEDDLTKMSANMPKTVCDNCSISGECKEYSPGAVCFFDDDFDKLPVRNLNANLAEREMLLKFDRTRLMRAIMAERVSAGGALDSRVSQAMDDYIRRKNDFVALAAKRNTSPVTASLTARGKPGIFSQLFGAAMPTGKRSDGDTEIPLNVNEPIKAETDAAGEVEITMTVTKDVPNKKE